MKKLTVFISVLLLFSVALANAPPVLDYPDVTVEFLADNLDNDNDFISVYDYQTVMLDQVALPFIGDVISLPEVTITVNPGTLDVNYYADYTDATQENLCLNNNLMWSECNTTSIYSNSRLFLASNIIEGTTVGGPTRLDIGELSGQTFYT